MALAVTEPLECSPTFESLKSGLYKSRKKFGLVPAGLEDLTVPRGSDNGNAASCFSFQSKDNTVVVFVTERALQRFGVGRAPCRRDI